MAMLYSNLKLVLGEVIPLPEGWPVHDHEEHNPEVLKAKLAFEVNGQKAYRAEASPVRKTVAAEPTPITPANADKE